MHLTYKKRLTLKHLALVTLFVVAFLTEQAMAERVKDLASVAGVRNNQLTGYGLVVGLNGTGDQTTQTPFTVQSIVNMLTQFGVTIPPGVSLQLKNVAAVTVHADLPPFAKPGQTIDVTVSSIGNAKSLRGGALLMAPMRGADGNVYAVAQGNLVVGGFGASGNDGSKVTVNIPSAGRIPNGATVERAVPSDFLTSEAVVLNLHVPDFTTSKRLAEQINKTMGQEPPNRWTQFRCACGRRVRPRSERRLFPRCKASKLFPVRFRRASSSIHVPVQSLSVTTSV